MKTVFSKYGIIYGWLGKQAILTVDTNVSVNEYDEFMNFAFANQADIERLVEKKKSFVEKVKENPMVGAKVAGIAALGALGGAVMLSSDIGLTIKKTLDLKKGIREQQYSCAIMKFYLEGLSAFLGM